MGEGEGQSACWRPRSVVEHEESQYFHLPFSLEYYLSALFALPAEEPLNQFVA